MRAITRFFIAFVLLLLVDAVYLGIIGGPVIRMFEKIQGSSVHFNYAAAAVVYVALAYLVTLPAADTVTGAAALGAATYAVYDFTNLAVFKNYTLKFALMDTTWGGTLFAIVSVLLRKIEVFLA